MRKKGPVIANPKQRGEWAELKFMARAAEQGLGISKPWGESGRYDVGVESGGRIWRVQVKSTMARCGRRSYACSARPNLRTRPYAQDEFDFLAAYVIPKDVWYIIPAKVVVKGKMGMIVLSPTIPGHKYEAYMEAWHLLRGDGAAVLPRIEAVAAVWAAG